MANFVEKTKKERLIHRYHQFGRVVALCTIVVGFLVTVGWIFDIHMLRSLSVDWVSMKLNTALCFMAMGYSLWVLLLRKNYPFLKKSSAAALFISFLISLLTLLEYGLKTDLYLDQCFVKESIDAIGTPFPGRMSVMTALNVLFSSTALLCFRVFKTRARVGLAQWLAVPVFLSSLDSMFIYAYGISPLDDITNYTQNALHTAVIFFLFSIAIFLLKPETGIAQIFTFDSIGGKLSRKIMPVAIIFPPISGYLVLKGEQLGFYQGELSFVILVFLFILIYSLLIWRTGNSLHQVEEDYVYSTLENKKLHFTNEQLKIISYYDALTGLPNRNYFHNLLEHAISRAVRRNSLVSVVFIDVDNFKNVNDTFGHEAGDKLLIEVAKRLKSSLRESDILARLGGDEFIVILEEPIDYQNMNSVVKRIHLGLSEPIHIDNHSLIVTLSMGVSFFPQDGKNLHTLVRNADIAMYQAKKLGKNRYQFYTAD